MKKKGHTPITRVKNPEPHIDDPDWVIWAAWADRITFEEIEKKTGKTESEVIKIMNMASTYDVSVIPHCSGVYAYNFGIVSRPQYNARVFALILLV